MQEEMRRTVAYFEWKANWWKLQASRRIVEGPLAQGLSAYAQRQSDLMVQMAGSSVKEWIAVLQDAGGDISWTEKYKVEEEQNGDESDGSETEVEENDNGLLLDDYDAVD